VARKSGKVRQELKAEQSRREDVREEYNTPRGKCAAKGGVIWRKERADNAEVRRQQRRI